MYDKLKRTCTLEISMEDKTDQYELNNNNVKLDCNGFNYLPLSNLPSPEIGVPTTNPFFQIPLSVPKTDVTVFEDIKSSFFQQSLSSTLDIPTSITPAGSKIEHPILSPLGHLQFSSLSGNPSPTYTKPDSPPTSAAMFLRGFYGGRSLYYNTAKVFRCHECGKTFKVIHVK